MKLFKFDRRTIAFVHDILVAGASLWLAMLLRVGTDMFHHDYNDTLTIGIPLFMAASAVGFRISGMYRGLWRYASVPDLVAIVKGSFLSVAIFIPTIFLINRLETLPRTVPLIQLMLLIMILGGSRLTYRLLRHRVTWLGKPANDSKRIPVLLYGAGDGAEIFIRSTYKSSMLFHPVGIIDDNRKNKGHTIHGVPVLGSSDNLHKILKRLKSKKGHDPQKIIITDREFIKDNAAAVRTLTENAAALGLSLGRLPELSELKGLADDGKIQLRPIAIEDLLGRPQKIANMDDIAAFIRGKRVMVTGAGGSIGSEICKQVASFAPESLVLIDNGEHNLYQVDMALHNEYTDVPRRAILADIRNRDRIFHLFDDFRPHIVFHAAAYKHVPMVEHNPAEGVMTNIIGTRNVADAALAVKVEAMVQISTDKAVNPTNVMGATKRIAESYTQALDLAQKGTGKDKKRGTRFMTVRFGNVLGSSGSVVPLFRSQLERGGPLTVTDPNIERYFMTIPEAVGLVLSASAHGMSKHAPRGQIFVLDMGDPVKIADIARQMIRLAGLTPDKDIKIVYTGLRPGEKMFEELFDGEEAPAEIGLSGVCAAFPETRELKQLNTTINQMEKAAIADKTGDILSLLGETVRGYDGQRSIVGG